MTFVLAQDSTFVGRLVEYYLEMLASPQGIAGLVVMLSLAVALVAADRTKWVLLAVLIYILTFGLNRGEYGPQNSGPIKWLGQISQPAAVCLLILLVIPAVQPREWRRARLFHVATICLFVLQLVCSARLATGGFAEKGLLAAFFYVLMLLVLGAGLSRWLFDMTQVRSLLRAVSWSAALVAYPSILLILVDPSQAFAGGRLYGTTPNPQRIGTMLALALPYSFALFQDRANVGWSRAFHAVLPAVAGVLVIGSGSRTGGLMCLVGVALYFRARLGPLLLTGLVVVSAGLAVFQFLGESLAGGQERILSTENTRSEIWSEMWAEFLRNPLFGSPRETASENSFLSIASITGVVGLVPLTFLIAFLAKGTARVVRYRGRLGTFRPVADLVVASVGQVFVAWMFEGFLLGVLTDHTVMLYCTLGLLALVTERIGRLAADGAAAGPADPLYDADPTAAEWPPPAHDPAAA